MTRTTTRKCPECGYVHIYKEKYEYRTHGFVGVISPTLTCVSSEHISGNHYFTLIRPTPNEPAKLMMCPKCKARINVKANTKISETLEKKNN